MIKIIKPELQMEKTSQLTLPAICEHLLQNPDFLSSLRLKLYSPQFPTQLNIDNLITQLSQLISLLIKKKIEIELNGLIQDNNEILQQIKIIIDKNNSKISNIQSNKFIQDGQFSQIHNLIYQEKKKIFQQLNDQEVEKSISMIGQYDDFVEKVNQLHRKVKGMEEKYQANFKSLWNVLSMTQSAIFDYVKQNKSKQKKRQAQIKQQQANRATNKGFWGFLK